MRDFTQGDPKYTAKELKNRDKAINTSELMLVSFNQYVRHLKSFQGVQHLGSVKGISEAEAMLKKIEDRLTPSLVELYDMEPYSANASSSALAMLDAAPDGGKQSGGYECKVNMTLARNKMVHIIKFGHVVHKGSGMDLFSAIIPTETDLKIELPKKLVFINSPPIDRCTIANGPWSIGGLFAIGPYWSLGAIVAHY